VKWNYNPLRVESPIAIETHPYETRRWRKSLKFSQREAADALGLQRRVVQYYEAGERDGEEVVIPKSVRLACYALALGKRDYHGPEED